MLEYPGYGRRRSGGTPSCPPPAAPGKILMVSSGHFIMPRCELY